MRQTKEMHELALKEENFKEIFEFSVYSDLSREAIASWLIDCPLDFGG